MAAAFSGHVDWHTGVTGVFWRLREVQPGDSVHVVGQGGGEIAYTVETSRVYPAKDAPIAEIVGPKSGQQITILTCEGVFNRSSGEYNQRRAVFGRRVP